MAGDNSGLLPLTVAHGGAGRSRGWATVGRRASDLLVEGLEAEGVRWMFGIPGEETLDLSESLERSGIELVPVRHEQGGALIADVIGRLTGRAGVALATLGPGATNLVTGVADAFLDRAPLVALTEQGDLERMHKESHQYIDVMAAAVGDDARPLARREPVRPEPSARELLRAADLIRAGRRVVALAGNGAVRGRAAGALREFSRATGAEFALRLAHALTLAVPSLLAVPVDYSLDVAMTADLGAPTTAT